MAFANIDLESCWYVMIVLIMLWLCVVWTLKSFNASIDEDIALLVASLSEALDADGLSIEYDYAWTELLKPMAAREWRALIITASDGSEP
eukprot:CAMPEP_0115543956 /NCGR_PEP_ID=MMETSP0271-20121206/91839_1 /TAXON_ID=71861 /ORGANISM="Scrippsiella trochoidea, Strain CCMP3099" /LENGTH=89 /DNA_ID=CAMNT_0002977255 /DNA_START=86 /DNA_END=352 /DNA_ORIENTATION=+